MVQRLGLRVVPEGGENQDTLDFLVQNQCEGAQGYYFSKPVDIATFENKFF